MLSIIIPVYNEEKIIEPMIRQFDDLRIPHEVIVSDTASTDKTVEIARRHADKVVTLDPEREAGASTGRNDGASVAEGDFFVFMDCGSMIVDSNDFFKKALARFREDPNLAAISVFIKVEKLVCTWSDAAVSWLMNNHFWFSDKFFGAGLAAGKFQMIRRDAFIASGGFDESLTTAEDIDLFGRVRKYGRVRIMRNLAIYHSGRRFHAKGAWRTLSLWIWNGIWFMLFKKPSHKWEPVR